MQLQQVFFCFPYQSANVANVAEFLYQTTMIMLNVDRFNEHMFCVTN